MSADGFIGGGVGQVLCLRPYQQQAESDLRRSLQQGHRSPLLVSPCGSGKTVVIASIINRATAKGRRVLFLAPRRELVYQCREKLIRAGVHHGLVMAGEDANDHAPVQVACTPTIMRRAKTRGVPQFDLVIQDESHIGVAGESGEFLRSFTCPRIGFTATPARTDGRGLGEIYDDLVLGPSVADLTRMGYLVPVRYFAPSQPDLGGVKVVAGDYNQQQLAARVDKATLVGDVVQNWSRICPNRKTIVSAVTVAHSLHLRDAFRAVGVACEHVDGGTPLAERASLFRDFREGRFQVLVNCEITTYGYDEPSVDCIVLAKPTKSIARYLQIAGRVLRPHPGKTDAILIDHSGAVESIGFVDDVYPWTLDGNQKVQEIKARQVKPDAQPCVCSNCKTVYRAAPKCPACGHVPQRRAKPVAFREDDLVELTREGKKANRTWTREAKARFYGELVQYAIDNKAPEKRRSWLAAMWKNKFGVWPRGFDGCGPSPVSMETASWIRSRGIAWAKSRARGPVAAPVHAGDTQGPLPYQGGGSSVATPGERQ